MKFIHERFTSKNTSDEIEVSIKDFPHAVLWAKTLLFDKHVIRTEDNKQWAQLKRGEIIAASSVEIFNTGKSLLDRVVIKDDMACDDWLRRAKSGEVMRIM